MEESRVSVWASSQCKPLLKCHYYFLPPGQWKPTHDITTSQALSQCSLSKRHKSIRCWFVPMLGIGLLTWIVYSFSSFSSATLFVFLPSSAYKYISCLHLKPIYQIAFFAQNNNKAYKLSLVLQLAHHQAIQARLAVSFGLWAKLNTQLLAILLIFTVPNSVIWKLNMKLRPGYETRVNFRGTGKFFIQLCLFYLWTDS